MVAGNRNGLFTGLQEHRDTKPPSARWGPKKVGKRTQTLSTLLNHLPHSWVSYSGHFTRWSRYDKICSCAAPTEELNQLTFNERWDCHGELDTSAKRMRWRKYPTVTWILMSYSDVSYKLLRRCTIAVGFNTVFFLNQCARQLLSRPCPVFSAGYEPNWLFRLIVVRVSVLTPRTVSMTFGQL